MKKILIIFALLISIFSLCWADPRSKKDNASELRQINFLINEVESTRGLKFTNKVKCRFCSQREASEYLTRLNKYYNDPQIDERRDLFFHHLQLLRSQENFARQNQLLYADQVRGLYDPMGKLMLVVTDNAKVSLGDNQIVSLLNYLNVDIEDIYLVHELCHALQDQNFALGDKLKLTEGNLDKELALTAVAEGDATIAMFDYLAKSVGLRSSMITKYVFGSLDNKEEAIDRYTQLKNAPLIVRSLALMPYFEGTKFCQSLLKNENRTGVDVAFRRVPRSTEEILHPLKYVQQSDPPKVVDFSRLPQTFGPYRAMQDDCAGEYVIRVLAQKYLPESEAEAIGRGWGGDTWRVYKSNNGSFVIWVSVWDSQADAQEFANFWKLHGNKNTYVQVFDRTVTLGIDIPKELLAAVKREITGGKIQVKL
ncbi:hypothetical protein IJT10_03635 [bacterium]|nr:hypothetical protein [bacterium]